MTAPSVWLRSLATDFKVGLLFCTRLPLHHSVLISGTDIARASWTLPIVGAIVGLLGTLIYWLAHELGLPPVAAAALALATTLVATGCLHEDGLADMVDGFGGGATRERKLEIMRDSRIGTYGACALTISLILRASAIASLADPALVASALIAAHASARGAIPLFMRLLPNARRDGLSADAGRPPLASIIAAGFLGTLALGLGLGATGGIIGLVLVLSAFGFIAWLCMNQIGGQTGDVVGALEQVNEVLILLTVVALT
jgi:adenosylcobinamide-GDP ribazoletransferase